MVFDPIAVLLIVLVGSFVTHLSVFIVRDQKTIFLPILVGSTFQYLSGTIVRWSSPSELVLGS